MVSSTWWYQRRQLCLRLSLENWNCIYLAKKVERKSISCRAKWDPEMWNSGGLEDLNGTCSSIEHKKGWREGGRGQIMKVPLYLLRSLDFIYKYFFWKILIRERQLYFRKNTSGKCERWVEGKRWVQHLEIKTYCSNSKCESKLG